MKYANKSRAALMGALLASGSAFAGLQTGDGEFGAFFFLQDTDATTTIAIQTNFGYMFTDQIQGQFRFGMAGSDTSSQSFPDGQGGTITIDGSDSTTVNFGLGANYLFGDANSDVVPYVGLGFDSYSPSEGDSISYTTLSLGAKFFINETTSLDLRLDNQSGDNDADQTILLAGINIYF